MAKRLHDIDLKLCAALSAAALTFNACSDNALEEQTDHQPPVITQLTLSLDPATTVLPAGLTRSTSLGFQNGSFADGTEIGLFILTAEDYQAYLEHREPDTRTTISTGLPATRSQALEELIAAAYPDGVHYGYENVRAFIGEDGSIRPANDLDLIYPIHSTEEVAVIAYAPYRTDATREVLRSGLPLATSLAQHTDEGLKASDALVGLPEPGNPFRKDDGAAVGLRFNHILSSVQLHLDIENGRDLRSDSIIVVLKDVVLQDTLALPGTALSLQQGGSALFTGFRHTAEASLSATRGDIVLARLGGLTEASPETMPVACNAVVMPQVFTDGRYPQFEITFKGRLEGKADTTVVRGDTHEGVTFRSGKLNIYRTTISSLYDEEDKKHEETLPEQGKDGVIIGAPRK